MFKNVLLGLCIFAALFTVLIFSGKIPIGGGSTAVTGDVMVWGTLPSDTVDTLLQDYNLAAKTYHVSYKQIPEANFSARLIDALANGTGPDMILAPYQIILSQFSKISPLPTTTVSEKIYKDAFVDGASVFWTPYGALALPVSIEPLVLFYNQSLFSKHGVSKPPVYWDELNVLVPRLTISDNRGGFIESAIALGTWNNIPYVKDILTTIVNQLGQSIVLQQYINSIVSYDVLINSPISDKSEILPLTTAVRFFTGFSDYTKSTYTWNQNLPLARDLFTAEKLAMYIGYTGEYNAIHNSNQKLDFRMSYLPQTKGYNTSVTGMRMYGLATLRASKNSSASFLTESTMAGGAWSPKIAESLSAISPLRTAVSASNVDEVIGKSAMVARGWLDIYVGDTNDLFSKMFTEILTGRTLVNDAVDTFVGRFTNLYNGAK